MSHSRSFHRDFYSDTEVDATCTPQNSRPSTPIQSDSEYEITKFVKVSIVFFKYPSLLNLVTSEMDSWFYRKRTIKLGSGLGENSRHPESLPQQQCHCQGPNSRQVLSQLLYQNLPRNLVSSRIFPVGIRIYCKQLSSFSVSRRHFHSGTHRDFHSCRIGTETFNFTQILNKSESETRFLVTCMQ